MGQYIITVKPVALNKRPWKRQVAFSWIKLLSSIWTWNVHNNVFPFSQHTYHARELFQSCTQITIVNIKLSQIWLDYLHVENRIQIRRRLYKTFIPLCITGDDNLCTKLSGRCSQVSWLVYLTSDQVVCGQALAMEIVYTPLVPSYYSSSNELQPDRPLAGMHTSQTFTISFI